MTNEQEFYFSEHVRWFIVEKPVKIGHAALEMMKDTLLTVNGENCQGRSTLSTELLMSGNNPDGNNRIIQPLRERTIYYFDMAASSCVPPLKKHVNSKIKFSYINIYLFIHFE